MYIRAKLIFILIFFQLNETDSQTPCSTNHTVGKNPAASILRDTEQGVAIMMSHKEYQYFCCGFINMWEFYVGTAYSVPGSFYAQVWRGGVNGGSGQTNTFTSTIIGYNYLTVTANGFVSQIIPNGQRIRCKSGDYMGMHSTGYFPLVYTSGGDNHDRLKLIGVLTGMPLSYQWKGYDNTELDYFIDSHVTPSKAPTIFPIFDFIYYNDELSIGSHIVKVIIGDDDIEDQNSLSLTMTVTNSGTKYFKLESTDNVTVIGIPPINKYTVTLKVQDPCFVTSSCSFTIHIVNRLPVINNLPKTINISEDTADNVVIFTINATDTVDSVTCSVIGVNSYFTLTAIDVYSKVGVVFNYDIQKTYIVNIRCTDGLDNVDGVLKVNLIRNDPPVIYSLPASISFSEDIAERILLHNLYVNDTNSDTITCTLNPTSLIFEVSHIATSMEYGIFLTGGKTLDYDSTSSYLLQVQCADHKRSTKGNYTVNLIRNMPPTIVNLPMSCNIPEDTQKETLIYSVSVTDPTNDTVACYISTTTTLFFIRMGANQFQFDIFVQSSPGFNYDNLHGFTLNISCADQRRKDSDYFFVYLIRNQPPKFINLQGTTTISSTMSTKGDVVFTVMAYDLENDQLQFCMNTSGNPPFAINQNTGEVSLTRSIMMDSTTGYDLSLYVNDRKNTVGPKTLTVLITDINSPPVFKNMPQTVSLLEGIPVGTVVFTPEVDDTNHMDVHFFSVSYNPPDGAVYFDISNADGKIITLAAIDYETITYKTFLLTVTVTDRYMADTGNLTIKILDINEAPTFTKKSYMFSAAEGNSGTVLQNPYYQCKDPEGDTLMFSFECGNNTGRLNMNKTNGFFSYAVNYDLDVSGTPSNLMCQVTASDGSYSDAATLNITISDENDNSPVFQHAEYIFFVFAKTAIGTKIGQVKAKDADIGRYGTFNYHIEQESIAYSLFNVSNNGGVNLIAPLTVYPEKSILRFKIYAVDDGGQDTSTNVTIIIPDTTAPAAKPEDIILYKTFFTYAPNMAWFVPAMFAVFCAVCVVIYTIGKAVSERDCSKREDINETRRKFSPPNETRRNLHLPNQTKRIFPMPRPIRQ